MELKVAQVQNRVTLSSFIGKNFRALEEVRQIICSDTDKMSLLERQDMEATLEVVKEVAEILTNKLHNKEAEALLNVVSICTADSDHGGLGIDTRSPLDVTQENEVTFLISAWLTSLNSADRGRVQYPVISTRPEGRRGMTLAEKIFSHHDLERKGVARPGDFMRVHVDWIMASEASWSSMKLIYDKLGNPGIFRNDRFWLAGDHVVDPRVNHIPQVKRLIDDSESAKNTFKLTEYQGMNYTIMHTEFYRERSQPGMLIIGSDSHTCSSGALGCLAIGLGAADVTISLITGETWFRIPESIQVKFVGSPAPGIGGKDVILYILKELKRNTVASDRIVEFTGPGLKHLSCDARFAISNMCTELGAITGAFVPDELTSEFITRRKIPKHKNASIFFMPDDDAVYAGMYEIDLSQVESLVALYPNPDDVVPISNIANKPLDGCFIGACTTTEEDLILGALVLEQGLLAGMKPVNAGKRKIVPGSRPVLSNLRNMGLIDIYEKAGFDIGIPGCSYCVGMSADRAGENEVWLSSQNRNFENRMGKGSIGNLASAAAVAASSFEMKVTDPKPLLDKIDISRWNSLRKLSVKRINNSSLNYVEPSRHVIVTPTPSHSVTKEVAETSMDKDHRIIRGKIQKLGDFIDTDALAPAEFLLTSQTNELLGQHCLEHTHPNFRSRVKEGLNVVVAGKAFGCGSSREQAVSALLGCGVSCVIAESFAFIYSRNQPNLGLLGITMSDDKFFEAAKDGEDIEIDTYSNTIIVNGVSFSFELSKMEKELTKAGGVTLAFQTFGTRVFEALQSPTAYANPTTPTIESGGCDSGRELDW